MDDGHIEHLLRRYRPVGPPSTLRERCLVPSRMLRTWPLLQELVPQYLIAAPIDPITGASLLYKTGADAYSIYSVGADRQDDGGDLTSTVLEAGQLRRGRGRDVGIRVVVRVQ